jgi:uncharacterized RDD family membrane protein YckC
MTAATPAVGAPAAEATAYVGLVTRALAFGVDAVIINAVALAVSAVLALGASVLTLPDALKVALAAAGGVAYVLWSAGYFVVFWSTTGQTPGARLLRLRVQSGAAGGSVRPARALLRFVGLTLAALPLLAGYLMILVDDRRRGLHDWLAGTVVVEAPRAPRARRSGPRAPVR